MLLGEATVRCQALTSSAGLSTVGLLALLIGLNQGEELGGWLATPVLASSSQRSCPGSLRVVGNCG